MSLASRARWGSGGAYTAVTWRLHTAVLSLSLAPPLPLNLSLSLSLSLNVPL